MKITKTLARLEDSSFFHNPEIAICEEATFRLAGIPDTKQEIARFTLSTKNPKKKGFRKLVALQYCVLIDKRKITTTTRQGDLLASIGVQENQSFWMKVELA